MGIKITKNFDVQKITDDLKNNLKRGLGTQLLDEAQEIISRTQAGKGVSGGRFKAYSDQYRKFRNKKGRRSGVDLTFTGNMLQSITSKVEVTADKIIGTIFFSSNKEALKASFNNVLRPFFGLSKDQVVRLTQKLKEAMRK